MASDAELRAEYNSLKSKRDKYEAVKNRISARRLNTKRSISNITDFISYSEGIIETVNGNDGYHYLSNFSSKLQEDVDTMQKYADFVRDANTSFTNLYNDLVDKINDLNTEIESVRSAYNEDKKFWERI